MLAQFHPEDNVAFNLTQTYRVSISAHNGTITVLIDGQVFYTGTDCDGSSDHCSRNYI